MITTATTLVIGAGASQPYGLPVGSGLLRRARDLNPRHPVYELLIARVAPGSRNDERVYEVNRFIEAITAYRGESIDAFLEDRKQFRVIGHEVIAALMGEAVRGRHNWNPGHVDPDEDWIGYLVRRMRSGAAGDPEGFCLGNKIKFVTFNFDTVIEDTLASYLQSFYGSPGPAALPEVIHVHGTLPYLPGTVTQEWITEAASSVKIIRDELDMEAVRRAVEAIEWADIVCFLGFGFHELNLETLEVKRILTTHSKDALGSAKGFREGEQLNIRRMCGGVNRLQLGDHDHGCREFLRRHDVLRS